MEIDEPLWSREDLAKFLGYSAASLQTMITKQPDRLPPRVEGLGLVRWVPSVVRAWVVEQSRCARPAKRGRPRKTPIVE